MPLRVIPRRDRKLNRQIKAAALVPLRRGEVLHEAGAPADHLFLVRSGHLRLVSPAGRGRRSRTVHVAGPWELTGEESLVHGAPRRYQAVAGEVSSVQRLEVGAVRAVLSSSRVTSEAFHAAWMDDLAFQRHLNSVAGRLGVSARVASVLLHLGGRFGEPVGSATLVPVRLTHRTLADLSGAHRSTVTTLLNDWLYEGWLEREGGGLRITEAGALRTVAGLEDGVPGPKGRPDT